MRRHFSGQRLTLNEQSGHIFRLVLNNKDGINTFNQQLLNELNHCLTLIKSLSAHGVIIHSEQRLFLAGGDIKEFQQRFELAMPERIAALSAFGAALNELSQLPCPSIALLNGATLGGGVELALCCDYRLALPKIKIGLPEVSLGIIPGTGGCVRLPRLVGLPAALEWICHGKIYHSEQALKIGLVDTIEENLEALELKAATLIAAAKLDNDCKYPQTTKEHATVCDQQQLSEQYPDDSQPARLRALQVIREQAELPIEQALAMETAAVAELGATAQSKRLVAAFVAGN